MSVRGNGSHRFGVRADNLTLADSQKEWVLQPGSAGSLEWRGRIRSPCESNPALWKLVAQEKIKELRANPGLLAASISENDGGPNKFCSCATCRSWDSPETQERFKADPNLYLHQESDLISDRVYRFYNEVAKLLWDPHRDVDPIIDDYCRAAYGPGAEAMKEYYRRAEDLANRIAATGKPNRDLDVRIEKDKYYGSLGDSLAVRVSRDIQSCLSLTPDRK